MKMLVALTACGQNKFATLPDDPMSETEAQETEASTVSMAVETVTMPVYIKEDESAVLARYAHLDPGHEVPDALLKKAILYFDAYKSRFANKSYMSVIDFSKHSSKKRFWIIEMKTGAVWGMRTAHGKGSDRQHDGVAESFSNVSGSNASSLGVYKASETYFGKYGLSLRLDGLSPTNSNARARAVVIHAAPYVSETNVIQGRSYGCPAVTPAHRDRVVEQLKGGSMIYAGLSDIR